MRTGFEIQARRADGKAEIRVFEPIGQDWLGNGTTATQFDDELQAIGDVDEIHLRINSPGGEVFDALAIYNALKRHPAKVRVTVEGLAASSASLIAMAGDELEMASGAMMMIHSPWMLALGNADELRKSAETLDRVEIGFIEAYATKSGRPENQIKRWLKAETWFTGSEAVEAGLADRVTEDDAEQLKTAARFAASFKVPQRIAAMLNPDPNKPADQAAILGAEQMRRSTIRARFGRFSDEYRGLLDECLDDPRCSPEAAGEKLLAKLGEGAEPMYPGYQAQPNPSRAADFRAAAADSLLIRAGIKVESPHAATRDVGSMSVLDIARTCMSQSGKSHRGLDGMRLIKAALSTSDFPGILEDTLGKAARNGYESDPQSHAAWVRKTMVKDFKTASRLLLGSAPDLAAVAEGGEYTYGGLSENKATLAVTKYGKALKLTWETLINDDLGSFVRVPQAMGAAARRIEADKVYEIFTANSGNGQTMQDTVALFHSGSHANVSATVGAISTGTLGAARSLLRKQLALGGGYLNLNPRFLIVPSESETLAEQILAAATRHTTDTVATTTRKLEASTPEWISKLQLVVEPRLNASYGFYVAAGSDQIDTVEVATLEADGGQPVIEEEAEFNVDAKSYKIRHVFVAKAIDWKGLVRVPVS